MDNSAVPQIGVMLTRYRRPDELLHRQMVAVGRQTVSAIVGAVWDNGDAALDTEVPLARFRLGDQNVGVWPRFITAALLDTDYVAVFDDDTIPGRRWFENCLRVQYEIGPSLVGAAGVSFVAGRRDKRIYHGWSNPLPAIVHVDIVGHAWFFPSALLSEWDLTLAAKWPTCGEDYYVAYQAQRRGWPVVVAPHPAADSDWWGSTEGHLGHDDAALYRQPGEEENKAAFHAMLMDKGWRPEAAIAQDNGDVAMNIQYVMRNA